jgi:hypothetical protein
MRNEMPHADKDIIIIQYYDDLNNMTTLHLVKINYFILGIVRLIMNIR